MKPKIIQTEADYQAALAHLETLMDATPGSPEEEELELFSFLVEDYEKAHFPIPLPDPVAAIEFRMQQQGLTRKDLQPYLGSQSKVSEVLSRKRPLSLTMIRKLHHGLDIPAEVLLQEENRTLSEPQYRWQDYPFNEMFRQGYFSAFNGSLAEAKEYAEELLLNLFSVFQGQMSKPVYCKRTERVMNENALLAWQARALAMVRNEKLPPFHRDNLDDELKRKLVSLSFYTTGPQLVREHLNKKGIHFIILEHLNQTHLDGATFLTPNGRPVIALTLRHDRMDNFWFTLMHELGHIYLHLNDTRHAFFDETIQDEAETCDPQEQEANTFARKALVPQEYWTKTCLPQFPYVSKELIKLWAGELEISPAIMAGRVRWEMKDFRKYADLIGRNQVREQFQDYRVPCE
jgi:HTH-type transcriptional regulator / antitoxin HigA